MQVGIGYDVHGLVEGRKLIIGGVDIPHKTGLLGHSDGDVLIHAIIDALLGAAGEGDIGRHFPDTDPVYEGISSIKLLKQIRDMLVQKKYEINNVDSTVVIQNPKIAPYIDQMRKNIAENLEISIGQVSVKAKTEEGLGFTGREEGIKAMAVCLLHKKVT
ncbi:MAG: 2-C-methyl-D-erythritol 2,4-cyclodiphosphate synthase [Candidatus Saganbacteria bacterium]|nr:2-C-methyl-D-erythritol 2,4-cyclodiphosphate synthase [Candidatus Saganbacteria bacterium]